MCIFRRCGCWCQIRTVAVDIFESQAARRETLPELYVFPSRLSFHAASITVASWRSRGVLSLSRFIAPSRIHKLWLHAPSLGDFSNTSRIARAPSPGVTNKSHQGHLQSKQVAILGMLQGQEPTKSGPICFKRKTMSLCAMLAFGFEPSQDVDTIRLRGFLCFKFHESQGHKGCVLKGGCIFPSKAMKEGRNAGRKERKEGRKKGRREGRKEGAKRKQERKEGS